LSFGIGLWVSDGDEWQESVTARADYAALLDASSKMPTNLASATAPGGCRTSRRRPHKR